MLKAVLPLFHEGDDETTPVNTITKECLSCRSTVRYALVTYLLNGAGLLEKETGFQLVKELPAFYGI